MSEKTNNGFPIKKKSGKSPQRYIPIGNKHNKKHDYDALAKEREAKKEELEENNSKKASEVLKEEPEKKKEEKVAPVEEIPVEVKPLQKNQLKSKLRLKKKLLLRKNTWKLKKNQSRKPKKRNQ